MFTSAFMIFAGFMLATFVLYRWFGVKIDAQNREAKRHRFHGSPMTVESLSFGDPECKTLILASNEWHTLSDALHTASPTRRQLFIFMLTHGYHHDVLRDWVQQAPDSIDAKLCLGARLTQHILDDKLQDLLADESIENLVSAFDEAAQYLTQVTQENPEDPIPWNYLARIHMLDHDAKQDVIDCLEQACLREPLNWQTHSILVSFLLINHAHPAVEAYLEQYTSTSSESHALVPLADVADAQYPVSTQLNTLLAHVARVCESAPNGHPIHGLVFKALLIEYTRLSFDEGDMQAAEAMLSNRALQSIADQTLTRLMDNPHVDIVDEDMGFFALANAAAWYWLTRDKYKLPLALGPINERIRPIHWRYHHLVDQLDAAREFSGLAIPEDEVYD